MSSPACAGMDTNIFFPEDDESSLSAIKVCTSCTMREKCLDYALEVPAHLDEYGIFGGKTPAQRYYIRRSRRELAEG